MNEELDLIYITTLINKENKEEIYVYKDKKSKKKYMPDCSPAATMLRFFRNNILTDACSNETHIW